MATHSSILAWRIPWTAEPGGLPTVHGISKSYTVTHRLGAWHTYSRFGSMLDFSNGGRWRKLGACRREKVPASSWLLSVGILPSSCFVTIVLAIFFFFFLTLARAVLTHRKYWIQASVFPKLADQASSHSALTDTSTS